MLAGSRLDAWYAEYGVAVELDGRAGHLDGWHRDLERDNAHAVHNAVTLRYGAFDLRNRPCAIARQVAAALRIRGWPGRVRQCRLCRDQTLT